MKKLWIIGILAALALIIFGTAGFAYAQSRTPNAPDGATGYGCGMDGAGYGQQANGARTGRGRMGGGMMGYQAQDQGDFTCPMWDGDEAGTQGYGPMEDYMEPAFAQALGITTEELEARRLAGDSLWTIAQEKGLTTEQFQEMMTNARDTAVNQAVADGVLTQEQADFMLEHMGGMMGNGYGPGYGFGGCGNSQR